MAFKVKEDVIDRKFGRLTILEDAPTRKKHCFVLCQCDCGNKKIVGLSHLKQGITKSCGCLQPEVIRKIATTHGLSKTPLYRIWVDIKKRCLNKDNKRYADWGGRGIRLCAEWENDPEKFIAWCHSNGWKKDLEIDRIDNDGDYSPLNCRFVTAQENNSNKRLIQKNNLSGYRGVFFTKRNGKWKAKVVFKGRVIFQRYAFDTPADAAKVRDEFCIKNNIPFPLNFPELSGVVNG